jgi:CRISPR/Cas system Type II protein with McrA/HNH and RuvC-like nuclease domain
MRKDYAAIYEGCKGICVYCGVKIEHGQGHIDHLVPLNLAHNDEMHNKVLACATCNLSKNGTPPVQWLASKGMIKVSPDYDPIYTKGIKISQEETELDKMNTALEQIGKLYGEYMADPSSFKKKYTPVPQKRHLRVYHIFIFAIILTISLLAYNTFI